MISELLRKWFGLQVPSCSTCDVLRDQLEKAERDRTDLIARLLDKPKIESLPEKTEDHVPIQPQFVPWRVRQQMLEQEDRQAARIARDRTKEIADLEQELGVK